MLQPGWVKEIEPSLRGEAITFPELLPLANQGLSSLLEGQYHTATIPENARFTKHCEIAARGLRRGLCGLGRL